jgi:hypothetical protein
MKLSKNFTGSTVLTLCSLMYNPNYGHDALLLPDSDNWALNFVF